MSTSNHLFLITGATRSGKSRLAVELARRFGPRILYLATCHPTDREMVQRVDRHRRSRPASWQTVEAPDDPASVLRRHDGRIDGAILDCLTMHVSRLASRTTSDETILTRIRALCETMRRVSFPVIVVTNEVGWGVVPATRAGRRFRDLAGLANQLVAQAADEVDLVVAGLPLRLKPHDATHGVTHAAHRAVVAAD